MNYFRVLKKIAVFISCIFSLLWVSASYTQAIQPIPDLLESVLLNQLQQDSNNTLRISYHNETGKVRFIGATPEQPITQPALLNKNATPEDAARGFLNTYGVLFGVTNPYEDLVIMKERLEENGRSSVRFQQTYQGIPILGGELIVQMSNDQSILAVSGEILPDLVVSTTPTIDATTATQIAITKVTKDYNLQETELTTLLTS